MSDASTPVPAPVRAAAPIGPAASGGPERPVGLARRAGYLAVGIVLLALNLRPALVAVSPLVPTIRAESGMSAAGASLLTALPLLCFGLLAPVAPALGRRWGIERTLLATMVAVCAGTVLRIVPGTAPLFAGTVVAGAGIAVANVLLPGLIKRDFPTRVNLMTSLYSMALFGGAALAAGVTLPVRRAADLSWQATLSCWGVLAAVAVVVWLPVAVSRRREGPATAAGTTPVRGLWRSAVAWQVTAFMGLQSLAYYAAAAWLPTLLQDAGMSGAEAGWMLSFSSLLGITGSFVTPLLVGRRLGTGTLSVLAAVLCGIGLTGLIVAPAAGAYAWMTLLGLGQGAAISLALLFILHRSPDTRHAAQLSGMAQCLGYVLAAGGPAVLGLVHDLARGWALPIGVLLVLLVPQLAAGLAASRPRTVRGRER
ncbi:CynX/NimT family MFS transporter (plasmid) [Streptomyces sp. BI20]|uniref:CynX/NimT family MFS transporter n=1 Tax=Streptomyces sp. BI20 TaxID=3403460 RepID=UPI003C74471B